MLSRMVIRKLEALGAPKGVSGENFHRGYRSVTTQARWGAIPSDKSLLYGPNHFTSLDLCFLFLKMGLIVAAIFWGHGGNEMR